MAEHDSERFYGELWRLYGVPVELAPETTRAYYTWDPHRGSVMIERDSYQDNELTFAVHEVCHFIVATRSERSQPEFGLGRNGWEHKMCNRTLAEHIAMHREDMSGDLMGYVAWRVLMVEPELTNEALVVLRFAGLPKRALVHTERALRAFEPEGMYARAFEAVKKAKEAALEVQYRRARIRDTELDIAYIAARPWECPDHDWHKNVLAENQKRLEAAESALARLLEEQRKTYT